MKRAQNRHYLALRDQITEIRQIPACVHKKRGCFKLYIYPSLPLISTIFPYWWLYDLKIICDSLILEDMSWDIWAEDWRTSLKDGRSQI